MLNADLIYVSRKHVCTYLISRSAHEEGSLSVIQSVKPAFIPQEMCHVRGGRAWTHCFHCFIHSIFLPLNFKRVKCCCLKAYYENVATYKSFDDM